MASRYMSQSVTGNVVRVEEGAIVVRLPADDIVIRIREVFDSEVMYEEGDKVALLKLPVDQWVIQGKIVGVT